MRTKPRWRQRSPSRSCSLQVQNQRAILAASTTTTGANVRRSFSTTIAVYAERKKSGERTTTFEPMVSSWRMVEGLNARR